MVFQLCKTSRARIQEPEFKSPNTRARIQEPEFKIVGLGFFFFYSRDGHAPDLTCGSVIENPCSNVSSVNERFNISH